MTSDRLVVRLGRVLAIGSVLSTLCLTAGLGASLFQSTSRLATTLLNLGLVIVLVTPVARVIVATLGFIQSREWRFVAMTAAVLAVLGLSVVAAFS
jgi:uncharacterized protein DUF1634